MAKRGLTGNEKRVLYGLVRHPTLNDRELSELLQVKVSTVTAIRRRLRRADYFTTRRLPMMHRLGWEILVGGRFRLDLTLGPQAIPRLREILKDRFPSIFHVTASSDHLVFLAFARNYTNLRRDVDDLRQSLDRYELLGDGDVHFTALPMTASVLPIFFDYSHALALAFGIEDRLAMKLEPARGGDVNLTRKETEVLKGLVRYPELSDKALAQRVKVSRQAVSKMRREFEADGLIRTVRLPNLRLLGFDLYVTAFARFSPSSTIRSRQDGVEKLLRVAPIFVVASDDAEGIVIGAAQSYEQFAILRSSLTKHFQERGFLSADPEVYVSLTNATEFVRNCDFGPLVQGLIEPETKSAR